MDPVENEAEASRVEAALKVAPVFASYSFVSHALIPDRRRRPS